MYFKIIIKLNKEINYFKNQSLTLKEKLTNPLNYFWKLFLFDILKIFPVKLFKY